MSRGDFIELFPNALDPDTCAAIIRHFEQSGQAERGQVGGGVDTRLKDSWDIDITGRPDWAALEQRIRRVAFGGLAEYVRRYPYTLLASLALAFRDPATGEVKRVDEASLRTMPAEGYFQLLQHAFRQGGINVQKYLADEGGYPYWHCEHYPREGTVEPLHRVLLYTIYLNDGFTQGETEFLYQQRKLEPQTGSLLIAPAFFTHTHRGNRPVGKDKYIATSWILFR